MSNKYGFKLPTRKPAIIKELKKYYPHASELKYNLSKITRLRTILLNARRKEVKEDRV